MKFFVFVFLFVIFAAAAAAPPGYSIFDRIFEHGERFGGFPVRRSEPEVKPSKEPTVKSTKFNTKTATDDDTIYYPYFDESKVFENSLP